MRVRQLLAVGLTLSTVACTRLSTQAKDDFAKEFSCPDARVVVKERPDLNADEVLQRKKTKQQKAAPPPDVAADPARLAKWTKDQADSDALRVSMHAGYDVFEVTGCDHKNLVVCHRPTGKGNNAAHPSCSIEGAP